MTKKDKYLRKFNRTHSLDIEYQNKKFRNKIVSETNTKKYCFSWENKASKQELSTENLSNPYLSKLAQCSWINQYQLDPRLGL